MSPKLFPIAGRKVLVMGLGRFGGGVGVARWLVEQGAIVTVNDAEPAEKLVDSVRQLDGLPIAFKLGGHDPADFLAADLLVINPAVDKRKSEVVREALARGVPFTTEMNLFLERNPAMTIGVTGSVGKSTTTAMIYEALKAGVGGKPEVRSQEPEWPRVFLGGNIGKSLLSELAAIGPADIVVLELSSFMLEDTAAIRWSPEIAVVTNVFANHLDRHDTLEEYAAVKRNILRFQTAGDTAILNADHEGVANWAELAKGNGARVLTYSTDGAAALPLLIPGAHNQSNARAAIAVIDALEGRHIPLRRDAALRAMAEFPGLAHRLQLIHTLAMCGGRSLRFYNDSKATSPDASITALNAFDLRSAIFIVGGYDKHIELGPFETLLARRAGGVIGIGQTGQAIVEQVRRAAGDDGDVLAADRIAYAGTLQAALPMAHGWAVGAPALSAVVLSPASASWGQFSNYEQRGEVFIGLARGIGAGRE